MDEAGRRPAQESEGRNIRFSPRQWRPRQLLASWAAYWAGLAGVTLGPAAHAMWRATHLPEGHGSISAGYDNGVLNVAVIEEGAKTFAASAPFGSVVMWIVGPPLVLWLLWLVVRERRGTSPEAAVRGVAGAERLMPGAPPAGEWRARRDDRVPVERERVHTPDPSA